jgi:hypothetical protein
LVITGSTSFHACIVASQTITEMLREVNPRWWWIPLLYFTIIKCGFTPGIRLKSPRVWSKI